MMAHPMDNVGALVRRDTGKNFRGAIGFQLFENGSAATHRRVVEEFDHARDRQHGNNGRGFGQGELVQQLSQIRGREIGHNLANADQTFIQSRVNPLQKLFQISCRHSSPSIVGNESGLNFSCWLLSGNEAISDPRFGENIARLGRIRFDLFAQVANEDAEVLGLIRIVAAPDFREQRAMRQDL